MSHLPRCNPQITCSDVHSNASVLPRMAPALPFVKSPVSHKLRNHQFLGFSRDLMLTSPLGKSICAALVLTTIAPVVAFAQPVVPKKTEEAPSPPIVASITAEVIAERSKAAAEIKDEELKKKVLELYAQATAQLESTRMLNVTLADLKARIANVPETLKTLQAQLVESEVPLEPDPAVDATSVDLEQRRIQAEQDAKTARDELMKWEQESKRRDERRVAIAKETQTAKDELLNIEKTLAAPAAPGEAAEMTLAARTFSQTRKAALEAQIALLNQEIPTYDATAETLKQRIAVFTKQAVQLENLATAWQKLVTVRREQEAKQRAEEARLAAASAHPALKAIAEENTALANLSAGEDGFVAKIKRAEELLAAIQKRHQQLLADQKSVEQKLLIDGMKAILGPFLLEQRRGLPNVAKRDRRIRERQIEIDKISWDRLDLRETQKNYRDIEPYKKAILNELPADMDPLATAALSLKAEEFLKRRSELLEQVLNDLDRLFNVLLALSGEERSLIDQTSKYAAILDEEILWLKSARELHNTHFRDTTDAFTWLVSPENWIAVGEAWLKSAQREWATTAISVLFILLLVWSRGPLRRQLADLGREADKGYTQPFQLSLRAFALTFVVAAFWPVIFAFLGWQLSSQLDAVEFTRAVSTGLFSMAAVLFIVESFRQICRPYGLGASHFRWCEQRLRLNRRHIRWFWMIGVPTAFVIAVIETQDNLERKDTLGRIALMFGLVLLTVFLARVLRPTDKDTPSPISGGSSDATSGGPSRFRRIWYWSFVSGPLVLAAMSEVGYHYMALQLSWRLLATATLGLLLVTLHALGMRWLYTLRAKLALEQAAQRRSELEAVAAASTDGSMSVTASPIPSVDQASLNLATVNSQTRRVLNGAITLSAVVGVWLIWSDVLPAFKFLDVRLWTTTQEVTKMVKGADGIEALKTLPETRLITLADLALGICVFAFAIVLARNIPGLMEVAILQHLPIDSGGSYAVSTLTRYAINVIGIIVAFNVIGVGWSQVQWLVAAMTFGLAFGMQEVFANFVSGLILFFERPIRIGDVVTIGDVTGSVSRIRIRATTVINWDRKEYVVPNKELITGRLLNWTLSDKINRVVITVGVAYGTDTDRTARLLQQILRDNEHILAEPTPRVTFEAFGESTLNFIVRAFLNNMDVRLDVIHWLHTEIHRRFAEQGIEIAFPQLDLHMKSQPTPS